MHQSVNPEMITLAREIRGLTQTKLAEISGIRQARISRYEGGVNEIGDKDLARLAAALTFPAAFFFQVGTRYGAATSELFHRSRRTVRTRDLKRIDGLVNLHRIGSRHLLKSFEPVPASYIPSIQIDEFGEIEQIAASVRALWQMPSGPVQNLIGWLEQASCLVFEYDFQTDKIDEVVQWIPPDPPIILVNRTAPADRLRFSLAHALGHLVMHRGVEPYKGMEKEADQFASSFLLPANDVSEELSPVSLQHMLELKPYWKVSMACLIYRAKDLQVIGDTRYRSLFQQLSRLGYRKKEPFPIERETPRLVKALIDKHRVELSYSDADLAKLLRVSLKDYYDWYYPKKVLQFPIDEALHGRRPIMAKPKKPGEIAGRSGEYEERGPLGGEIRKPREVSIDRGDKMPPTRKPNRTWRRIGPKKP